MITRFPQLDAPVVVVEASQVLRMMMTKALKDAGFDKATGLASIKEAVSHLEVETAAWLIAPLSVEPDMNLFGLLRLCLAQRSLRGLRVSAIVTEEAAAYVPQAFELGLLSTFRGPMTTDTFSAEIAELAALATQRHGDTVKIAAHYLRASLKVLAHGSTVVDLEKRLCAALPGDAEQLSALGMAYLESGDLAAGRSCLIQAVAIVPELDEQLSAASAAFLEGGLRGKAGDTEAINMFGVKRVLIVDSDETACRTIADALRKLGIEDHLICVDGESGLDAAAVHAAEIGLIIHEWRLPKVPGYLFIQRLRALDVPETPIFVVSSLLQPEDRLLLIELGASDLLPKPLSVGLVVKTIIGILQQERAPTQPSAVELKLRKLIAARKLGEAESLLANSRERGVLTPAFDALCDAHMALARGDFTTAMRQSSEALRRRAPAVTAQGVLGKALLGLGQYDAAIRCFERNQQMSPKNIERLCTMAHTYREMGDEAKADAAVSAAAAIDAEDERVQESILNQAMASEDPKKILEAAKNLRAEDDIIALTNNRAVGLVKIGRIDDGLQLYESITNMLPQPSRVKLVPVRYNIGLALTRRGDLERATSFLKRVEADAAPEQLHIKKKAASLRARIEEAMSSGRELKLNAAEVPANGAEAPDGGVTFPRVQGADQSVAHVPTDVETAAVIELAAGDACLYLIYAAESWPEVLVAASKAIPLFTPRESIVREESMGLDKAQEAPS